MISNLTLYVSTIRQVTIFGTYGNSYAEDNILTLFRMDLFGAAHRWGGVKKAPPPPLHKICYTYPTMMKRDTIIPYQKKIKKHINHVTHLLSSAGINIFSPKFSRFCYYK